MASGADHQALVRSAAALQPIRAGETGAASQFDDRRESGEMSHEGI
jgi:hypothetical protein